ncbi:MAG: fluoride efflux transporter CrcB [Kofleriaceae bacterium]
MNSLWVGIGGAVGSIARYQIGLFAMRRWPTFPWGTLAINLLGSLLLSFVLQLALRDRVGPTMTLALTTGVLGGFTTYSSFNHETLALMQSGAWARAAVYLAGTVLGCLVTGLIGWHLARAV